MGQSERVRVGVLAADPLRAIGLEAILEQIDGLEPVTLSLEQLLRVEVRPGLLVLDDRIAGGALPELLMRLRREMPGMKTIVLGESMEQAKMQSIIGSGAKGYLHVTAAEAEIRMALDVVLDGSVWAPRKVLARLLDEGQAAKRGPGSAESVVAKMTPREKEVLALLQDGRTNRDIASALGIDETTVKAHLGRMLRKTGASNRVELTLRAIDPQPMLD